MSEVMYRVVACCVAQTCLMPHGVMATSRVYVVLAHLLFYCRDLDELEILVLLQFECNFITFLTDYYVLTSIELSF